MILTLWMAASAHGPASALLEVLAWDDRVGCAEVSAGRTPKLVRANFGVLHHGGDGVYDYGCPSRWGGSELAMVAYTNGMMVASGNTGTFVSTDDACSAAQVGVTPGQTPMALAAWDDAAWLVTRDFDLGGSVLWRVDRAGASEVLPLGGDDPDGLLGADDGLWIAGSAPGPFVWRFDGAATEAQVVAAWPATPTPLDRLAPRLVTPNEVWLVAGSGATRRLWRLRDGEVTAPLPDAGIVHGPARLGDALLAVVDGVLWTSEAGGAWASQGEVDWTCLHERDGVTVACALDEVRVLAPGAGVPSYEAVMSLAQVGPPLEACDGAAGQCDLDWLHFGGESGWIDSTPADCPDGEREVIPPMILPPVEDGCDGCGGGRPSGWALLVALLWRRARRSAAEQPGGG